MPRIVKLISFFAVLSFTIGCNGGGVSDYQKACDACVAAGGVVERTVNSDGTSMNLCKYQEVQTGDDGDQIVNVECELQSFYAGTCDDSFGSDSNYTQAAVLTGNATTIRESIRDKVEDILNKLDNTGYSHRPFDLHPDYKDLSDSTDSYNLFLDCSGFVGYYVLQGIANVLYEKLPREYSCGPLTEESGVTTSVARPLAADFYGTFSKASDYNGNEATSLDDACWGKISNIKNALPGDVIAYLHSDNLDMDTKYCCYKEGSVYKTRVVASKSACSDGRIIYKAKKDSDGNYKNTGHVMFVHNTPYRSTEKKDDSGNYQWIVEVADSTTAAHMFDSRKVGDDESVYLLNNYHAWTKGDEGYVQRCENGSYHRDCNKHDTNQSGDNININTSGDHATGIGVGRIYINDGMDGYRSSYSADTTSADIAIGRPIPCGS